MDCLCCTTSFDYDAVYENSLSHLQDTYLAHGGAPTKQTCDLSMATGEVLFIMVFNPTTDKCHECLKTKTVVARFPTQFGSNPYALPGKVDLCSEHAEVAIASLSERGIAHCMRD